MLPRSPVEKILHRILPIPPSYTPIPHAEYTANKILIARVYFICSVDCRLLTAECNTWQGTQI